MNTPVLSSNFNLIDEAWVQCLMLSGEIKCLSLREVFEQLDQIRSISGDSPQQDYAVFRVLLAIFWRAHAQTEEVRESEDLKDWWEELFTGSGEEVAAPVFDYLEKFRDRFNLFNAEAPFMQVADLATKKGEYSSVQRLIPEAELDYFTMRAGSGRETLTPAEAARWLIAIQAWDYSGIKPGALGDHRVKGGKGYPIGTGWAGFTGGVVMHGAYLAQTLLLNTPVGDIFKDEFENTDLPPWERPPATAAPRSLESPEGPCDILTWQSRRVRLFVEQDTVTGALVTNGDKIEIRNQFSDPMTGYRYSSAQSKKGQPVFFAKSHPEERTLWRGVDALLAGENLQDVPKGKEADKQPATLEFLQKLKRDFLIEDDQEIQVELVGFVYGSMQSVITNSVHEVIPFKLRTLINQSETTAYRIVQAARRAVQASIHLGQFAGFLAEAAGDEYKFVPATTERVLSKLETSYKNWLLTITPEADLAQRLNDWCDTVEGLIKDEAAELAQSAGNTALVGRLDPHSDKPRLLSTATALGRLHHSLGKTLERIPTQETEA